MEEKEIIRQKEKEILKDIMEGKEIILKVVKVIVHNKDKYIILKEAKDIILKKGKDIIVE